jgi:site-specific DNA-methyltransferase (adenine-specific)
MNNLPLNQIICGDALEVLKTFPENSIDTIITDPPYGLGFMNKEWDNPDKEKELIEREIRRSEQRFKEGKSPTKAPFSHCVRPGLGIKRINNEWYQKWSYEWAKECLRVAKPGATLLCFGGTRTWHRLACAIEDAGWVIKDTLMWLYGSGFPKATDISKQIDKMKGVERKVIGKNPNIVGRIRPKGATNCLGAGTKIELTESTTPEAQLWNGWKSHGLKPAWEPIIMAMKPNEGSYAENALKYSVSGLAIDLARIGGGWKDKNIRGGRFPSNVILECTCDKVIEGKASGSRGHWSKSKTTGFGKFGGGKSEYQGIGEKDNMKAIIHTNPECPCYMLDKQSGNCKSGGSGNQYKRNLNYNASSYQFGGRGNTDIKPSTGGASRFFYVAKASRSERNMGLENLPDKPAGQSMRDDKFTREHMGNTPANKREPIKNNHPTVKPLKLMEYLCLLTKTPTGGIVLDPFAGSGTTGMACKKVDRDFILIEKEKEYCQIAEARINSTPAPLL